MSTLNNNICFILGNGPSAKSFLFDRINQLNTFGMNAAYRYWHKIKKYPKFYSCLDLVVGLSHIEEISELIINSNDYGIEKFLLRKNLVDNIGSIENSNKIYIFEDLVNNKNSLLSKIPRITTGAGTAAWAVDLGFQELYLYGVDINYIENLGNLVRIPDTKFALEVKKDFVNPNYFFEDYHKKGDKLNIPNPNINDPVHQNSWVQLHENIPKEIKLFNSSKVSKLDLFPYKDYFTMEHEDVLYSPEDKAHINEIDIIYDIINLYYPDIKKNEKYILDVGSFSGFGIKKFAQDGWNVHAFEPSKNNFSIVSKTLKDFPNVKKFNFAISNYNSINSSFYESKESKGISSLLNFSNSHYQTDYSAEVKTLKKHCEFHKINNIFLLKIDTEGHDLNVLKSNDWSKIIPEIILCEFENNKTNLLNYSTENLILFLKNQNYNIFISEWHPIVKYGIKHNWKTLKKLPYKPADNSWGNILAFKNQKISEHDIKKLFLESVKVNQSKKEEVESPMIKKIKQAIEQLKPNIKIKFTNQNILSRVKTFYSLNKKMFFLVNFAIIGFLLVLLFFKNNLSIQVILILIFNFITLSYIFLYLWYLKNKINFRIKKNKENLNKTEEKFKKIEENLYKNEEKFKKIEENLYKNEEKFKKIEENIISESIVKQAHGHNRKINYEEIFKNLELLNNKVKLNFNRKLKYIYIADKFIQLEKNLVGRFASSIENLLFRFILSSSLKKDKINILEIGTLFGISIQLIIKELKLNNVEAFVDIIDPLNGFYNKHTDPITEYNVSVNIFNENMKMNGINQKKINLITMYSTEDRINFKFNPYDIIFVDGDHSYLGVENDFNLSNSNLNKNGILVFDDYKNNNWPGVTEFVDKKVLTNDKFIKIFDAFNLIAFKKIH